MNTRTVFGLIVRTVGLVVLVASSVFLLPGVLSLFLGGPYAGLLLYGIPNLIIGLWLLRGARGLVAFAYPEGSESGLSGPVPEGAGRNAPAAEP